MKVTVNSRTMEVAETTNLYDFLQSSKVKPDTIIVVVNDVVIRKDKWTEKILQEGDSMELVSLVGGG